MEKFIAAVIIILFCFIGTAGFCAEGVTVGLYQKTINSKNNDDVLLMKNYVRGVLDGINWSNTLLLYEKKQPIFCPPENLGLNTNNALQILNDEIKSKNSKSTELVSMLLLFGLQRTFPCDK